MFAVLLGKAKAASHATENPDGSIVISIEDLAGSCCTTKGRASSALKALEEGEMVSVGVDRVGLIRVTLNGFAKWQTPRQSKAERMEVHAHNKATRMAAITRTGRDADAGKKGAIRDDRGTELALEEEEEGDTERTTPSAHASAPAHEAASGGGDAGFNQVERIAAELARYRRDIGNLSIDLQSAESAIRDERGIDIEPTWLLEHLYRPTAAMLHEYGRDATRAALAAIAKRPDVAKPKPYMRTVAEREAAKPAGPVKPAETFQERQARADKAAMLAGL
jgi:hypothetical protein